MTKPSLSPNSRSAVRTQWRQAVLTLLEQEHTPAQLASQLGIAHWTAREIVNDLRRERLVTRIAQGRYLRASPGGTVPDEPLRLIRDQLLEYLTEPRKVADVARHIERSSSIATGHLNRLQRHDLVQRIAYGVYVRSDCYYDRPIQRNIGRVSPIRDDICDQMAKDKSIKEISQAVGRTERQVRYHLHKIRSDRHAYEDEASRGCLEQTDSRLRMNLRQFEQVVWHRLRPHPCPCEAGDHGSEIVSSVEAILEFGEVTRHVLATDSAIGTGDRRLDVAKSCVDPLECRRTRRKGSASCDDDLMRTSCLGDATEAAQAIADHPTVRCEAGFGKGGNGVGAETRHTPELEANWLAVSCGLDRRDERGFALRTASAFAAAAFTADIRIVDLDATSQLLGRIPFEHDLRQLVLELPRRGLGDAEAAAEFDAGDALLALRHMIEGAEPGAQRQLGRCEDGPGDRRRLQSAGAALKEVAGRHQAMFLPAALRAFKSLWPSGCYDDRSTLCFGPIKSVEIQLTEAFLELHRVASHCRNPRFQSIAYADSITADSAEQDA